MVEGAARFHDHKPVIGGPFDGISGTVLAGRWYFLTNDPDLRKLLDAKIALEAIRHYEYDEERGAFVWHGPCKDPVENSHEGGET